MKWLFIAILAGIAASFAPWAMSGADLIVELFLNMLKLISLPIIFLAIVSTIINMEGIKEAKSLIVKTLRYTLLTTLLSASLALVLYIVIRPVGPIGEGAVLVAEGGSYLDYVKKIIPDNLGTALVENNVLGMSFIAGALAIAILSLPEETRRPLKRGFGALFQALLKISGALIRLLPLAIFGFTAQFVVSFRGGEFGPLAKYALTVILANVIQGVVILPLILKMKGIPPFRLFRHMAPALSMAFFSKSSNATLPLTMKCSERAGVSEKVRSFTLPLCSIINMNGCAAFMLITTLFVAASHGVVFSVWEMIPWIFLSTLAAVGNAGVPMGCYFLTSAFVLGMGLPLTTLGLILPLYAFFDMVETALNVWSDSCVTAIVDLPEKEVPVTL